MDKALKQRLVGASVLIALVIVVLPMLLSGQPQNQQEARRIEVPAKPSELSFETRRFPIGQQDSANPSVLESTAANTSAPKPGARRLSEDSSAPQTPAVSSPAEIPDNPDQHGQAGEFEEGSQSPGRYLVQVASFSTTTSANNLVSRLKADGLPVLTDTVEASVGTLHRVRVGPFDQVSEANDAVRLIRTRTPDVKPRVMDLRPDESAPVTEPSDPLVRWVVQVGSFSNADNAESLLEKLRSAGFSAYAVTVSDTRGTRHNIRVGPEIERQSAIRIAAEIRQKINLDGIVMSVD